jgi:hypothetical protein
MKTSHNLVLMSVLTLGSAALATPVFIDFEALPDGSFPTEFDPVAESYADWGVSFWEIDLGPGQPTFRSGYGGDGLWAGAFQCGGYPPGFNIVADFTVPVYMVSADVSSAYDVTVTMEAKDAAGMVIGSVTSGGGPSFWKGTLSLETDTPIASLEWWPSLMQSGVGVDNLFYEVPAPATLSLLALSGVLSARRRR